MFPKNHSLNVAEGSTCVSTSGIYFALTHRVSLSSKVNSSKQPNMPQEGGGKEKLFNEA
jgi:hypothetical protein